MEDVIVLMIVMTVPLAAVIGGIFVKPYFRYREHKLAVMSDQTAERAAQYAAKTERLEQRVAVLERIITDRSTDLSAEIERLRDKPLN